jgi:hypothetical protein
MKRTNACVEEQGKGMRDAVATGKEKRLCRGHVLQCATGPHLPACSNMQGCEEKRDAVALGARTRYKEVACCSQEKKELKAAYTSH